MILYHYILMLPEDLRKRRQLNIKLRQYQERMRCSIDGVSGPDALYHLVRSRHYLIRCVILERLLKNGWVDLASVQFDLIRHQTIRDEDEHSFVAAASVIIDYVIHDGKNLIGGLGLPDIKD